MIAQRAAHLKPDHCPWCGQEVDRATHWGEKFSRPSSGDAALCINCGSICIYDRALRLRRPTRQELKEAEEKPTMISALRAWRAMKEALTNERIN